MPEAVQSFFRQVTTANRLIHDAFNDAQLKALPPEAEVHMEELLKHLQEGKRVCALIGEHRGTLKGYVLAKSDFRALDEATTGVMRTLGLCVAEVAADAMP